MKIQIPLSRVICSGAFTIIKAPNSGKTYVVPAWVEVPEGTQLSDIEIVPDKTYSSVVTKPERKSHTVKGSTGKLYTVIIDSNLGNSCSCPGFGFYRKCKHIQHVLTKHTVN
jgi:hypothetical protein